MTLRILTLGTADYLGKFKGLKQDCERLGYQFHSVTIPPQNNISEINHRILEHMVDYIENTDFERLCFMDPECRVIQHKPSRWINTDLPVMFYKVRNKEGSPDPKFIYKNKHGNGERLPCRIIGQPMFISKSDVQWFKMTLELSKAASDPVNKEFTRNEMFIETALEYNNVEHIKEYIFYDRMCDKKQSAVKGLWTTEDTIIQHPDVYGLFDQDIKAGNPLLEQDPFVSKDIISRHTKHLEQIETMNELLWKEKANDWVDLDVWCIQPSTGKIMFKGLPGMKYHYSIADKISKGLNTPAVKEFTKKFPDKDLA